MKGFCQVVDVDYEVIDNEEIYKLTENHDFDEQDNHMELGPQAMYYKSSTSVSSTSSNEDRSEENFVPAYQNESLIIDQSNITAEEDKLFDFPKTDKPSIALLPTRFAAQMKFWKHRQNQTIPIDVNFVAGEMQTLYKWMPERIDNVNAQGDVVEWSKSDLGNEWSQVVEYMCKDLNIKYEVFGNENENAP
ncbi:13420_t:CDS:2 [Entrophospora sp. SA101]|nr:13420_t:CDS:2 [Entrophospora sp. SA101]